MLHTLNATHVFLPFPPFVWFSWWLQIVLNSLWRSFCLYVGSLWILLSRIFVFSSLFCLRLLQEDISRLLFCWDLLPRMWIWTGEPKVISEHGLHSAYCVNAAGFELHMFPQKYLQPLHESTSATNKCLHKVECALKQGGSMNPGVWSSYV